jgi:hypothetical protein
VTKGAEDPIIVAGTTWTTSANWVGDKSFTIEAVDFLGNVGPAEVTVVTKQVPNPPSGLRADVVDNNVLLYWQIPAITTLPITGFEIRRGATWETATLLGRKDGAFTTLFETSGGTYKYWLASIDSDAQYSTPVSLTATVSQPADYVLYADLNSLLNGTLANATLDANAKVVLPVATLETVIGHFGRNQQLTSNDITTWSKGDCTIALAPTVKGPDGLTGTGNVFLVTETGVSNTWFQENNAVKDLRSKKVGFAIPLKMGTHPGPISMSIRDGAGVAQATVGFNFATGTAGAGGWMTLLQNGWYLCAVVVDFPAGAAVGYQAVVDPTGTPSGRTLYAGKPILVDGTGAAWATPQAQVTAGYPIFIQPAHTDGYYEEVIDYGTLLSGTRITLSVDGTVLAGVPAITSSIDFSADGLIYVPNPGVTEAPWTAWQRTRAERW